MDVVVVVVIAVVAVHVVVVEVVVVVLVEAVVIVVVVKVLEVVVVQSNHTLFGSKTKKYPQSVLYDMRLAKLCLSVMNKYFRSTTTYVVVLVG